MLGMHDGIAAEGAGGAAQQHYASRREATPQSQQPGSRMSGQHLHQVQQQQGDAGADVNVLPGASTAAGCAAAVAGGVTSSIVRGVGGSLGQLVRAPVAAIKQLLPGWASTSHEQQQQQQQQGAPPPPAAGGGSIILPTSATAAAAATSVHAAQPGLHPVEGDGESTAGVRPAADTASGPTQQASPQQATNDMDAQDCRQPHPLEPVQGGWDAAAATEQQLLQGDVAWQQQQQQRSHDLFRGSHPFPPQQQQQRQQHVPVSSPALPGMLAFQHATAQEAPGAYNGGSSSAGFKPAGKAASASKLSRQTRCGKCRYCLNKHLKKGCEANKVGGKLSAAGRCA